MESTWGRQNETNPKIPQRGRYAIKTCNVATSRCFFSKNKKKIRFFRACALIYFAGFRSFSFESSFNLNFDCFLDSRIELGKLTKILYKYA